MAPRQMRLFPTSPKTRRASLFRRSLGDPRSVRHARGNMGTLLASPAFAGHHLVGPLRSRLSSVRRVPMTPRRPPVVARPRHLLKWDQLGLATLAERRLARSVRTSCWMNLVNVFN